MTNNTLFIGIGIIGIIGIAYYANRQVIVVEEPIIVTEIPTEVPTEIPTEAPTNKPISNVSKYGYIIPISISSTLLFSFGYLAVKNQIKENHYIEKKKLFGRNF